MPTPRRRIWLIALGVSLLGHTLFFGYMAVARWSRPLMSSHTSEPGGAATPDAQAEVAQAQPYEPTAGELDKLIADEMCYVRGRSPAGRIEELERRAEQVATIDAESVRAAASRVESALGVPSVNRRTYQPRPGGSVNLDDPDAMQPAADIAQFDVDSSALYDIVKRTDKQGRTVYISVYIDKDGNLLRGPAVLDADLRPEDRAAFGVFEMARNNPNLAALLDSVRRIAEQRQAQQAPAATDNTPPPSPTSE